MKINFLGTAGLVPGGLGLNVTAKRCQLVMLIDDDYLLETGDGALRNINAFGVDLNNIKRIMISHKHSDHFIGIVHVLFDMMNVRNRKEPLEIIGPQGIEKATRGLMSLCELPVANDEQRGYQLIFRELGNSEAFDDIQTVKGEHPSEAHAYRITRNGKSIFYNGESSYTDEVIKLAQGADLFISTVVVTEPHDFHISPAELGRAATAAGVKRLAVVHWPTEYEERKDDFKKLIEEHFAGEVIVPDDFTVIEV
ncbi:MBL fold metallo-hydrolase [Phosphitispora fastidiosa]|uniref:MBL fold metallo-hydrolase n=1 Tax=Phosphitispora fastidiosa TaxID=2837202 RepID=UPI001E28E43A|nr:MBL fold metallo-hydrolase [Phosphitispora fastidiosa]MBU7006532.1 ribonuclease BN (tRNA processing enzyme) [Phosphitispora fastidiosa]